MASREENLKKINDELEAMSDDELEKVAGGTYKEVAGDSRFLNDLANLTDRYGATRTFFQYSSISDEVVQGWSKAGIALSPSFSGDNKYFLNGNQISREDAMNYAAKQFGKDLRDMPFNSY